MKVQILKLLMNFRIENKYEIEGTKLNILYKFLKKNNAKILHPGREINSVYFENNNFNAYHDSLEGNLPRKKIRLRSYPNNSQNIKKDLNFEIKINSIEGKIKTSKKILDHEKLLKFGFYDFQYGQCYPIVETNYFREYYNLLNIRLTIDKNIKYSYFKKKNRVAFKNECIIEIKSNDTKASDYIDKNFHFKKIRFSKYCNAIEDIFFP